MRAEAYGTPNGSHDRCTGVGGTIPGHGRLHLRKPLELLGAWRGAYRFDRHPQRSYFTLLRGRELQEKLRGLKSRTDGYAAYAAFSAAEFQAPHVRQPKTWLFIGANWEDDFREAVEAKPVDSGENVVVLIPNDAGVFYLPEGGSDRLPCTNPVQTCVDLCHCGGRGGEAAEAFLEQELKPQWNAGEYRVVLPDGTQRWIAVRGRTYPDTHRKPAPMLGTAIGIHQAGTTGTASVPEIGALAASTAEARG